MHELFSFFHNYMNCLCGPNFCQSHFLVFPSNFKLSRENKYEQNSENKAFLLAKVHVYLPSLLFSHFASLKSAPAFINIGGGGPIQI